MGTGQVMNERSKKILEKKKKMEAEGVMSNGEPVEKSDMKKETASMTRPES